MRADDGMRPRPTGPSPKILEALEGRVGGSCRGVGPRGVWLALVLAAVFAAPSLATSAEPPLSIAGAKAFDMARSADDAAAAAAEEGDRTLTQVKALTASGGDAESLKVVQAEAEAAHQALVVYRRQAQASATEALQLLADATRVAAATRPDPVRRETLEQRALLAAYESTTMAARARAEAERLRALHAEARAVVEPGSAAGRGGPRALPPAPSTADPRSRDVVVPNLVGARLEAAIRDLEAAGLRLGGATGPREGFVVKQVPDGGTRVPRQAAVSVTLSATAATTTP